MLDLEDVLHLWWGLARRTPWTTICGRRSPTAPKTVGWTLRGRWSEITKDDSDMCAGALVKDRICGGSGETSTKYCLDQYSLSTPPELQSCSSCLTTGSRLVRRAPNYGNTSASQRVTLSMVQKANKGDCVSSRPKRGHGKTPNVHARCLQVELHLYIIFNISWDKTSLGALTQKFQTQRQIIPRQFTDKNRESETSHWHQNLQITK